MLIDLSGLSSAVESQTKIWRSDMREKPVVTSRSSAPIQQTRDALTPVCESATLIGAGPARTSKRRSFLSLHVVASNAPVELNDID